ncbi:MAG: prepilin-type N-terminal cleavage/methylation domain-containing protein, partial [Sedimentisphaerales bacterium]|nr:prepilin-type N-terminal cleavage/methylation domain-containing protein [Sedimentisphaerales bacterium]
MKKNNGFTIVELLTSIVIIVILLGLLLPSLAKIRRSAKEAAQKVQFATIDTALEAFKQDYGDYPPSDRYEDIILPSGVQSNRIYCGAQKLTEALLGWDLQGFDPNTSWRRDGYSGNDLAINGNGSYDPDKTRITDPTKGPDTFFERKGPYLEVAKTPVFRLAESAAGVQDGLYSFNNPALAPFDIINQKNWVICDVFGVKKIKDASGKIFNAGSPVLYYKANTNFKRVACQPIVQAQTSIYNLYDNLPLGSIGALPDLSDHKLFKPAWNLCSEKYKIVDLKVPYWFEGGIQCYWPNRPDSYI